MSEIDRRRSYLATPASRNDRLSREERRTKREIEAQGAIDRARALEEGRLVATQVDVVFALGGHAATRADGFVRYVYELGAQSERSEQIGMRFVNQACRKAEGLIESTFGKLG
jgi:hypothetical protein